MAAQAGAGQTQQGLFSLNRAAWDTLVWEEADRLLLSKQHSS